MQWLDDICDDIGLMFVCLEGVTVYHILNSEF